MTALSRIVTKTALCRSRWAVTVLAPLFFSSGLMAEVALLPYTATFTAKSSHLPIEADATYSLIHNGNNSWTMVLDAEVLIFKVKAHAEFTYAQNIVQPKDYRVQTSVMGRKRTDSILFDWPRKTAASRERNKRWNVPLLPNDFDPFSFQQQLQIDAIQGRQQFSYQVIDGDDKEPYAFQYVKEELLHTPVGPLQTVQLMRESTKKNKVRRTLVWLARDWNYIPVQIQHLEPGKNHIATLRSATVNNKTVHGITPTSQVSTRG